MAVRKSLFAGGDLYTQDQNPFLAGGSPTVPPTAEPTDPSRISPGTFTPPIDFPAPPGGWKFESAPSSPYHYDPNATLAAAQPFIHTAEDPAFESQLTALYHKYGRADPTPDEMLAHAGNPGGLAAVEAMLKASSPSPDTSASGNGSGVAKAGPARPVIQIGGDAQSQAIDAGLADLIAHGGATADQTAMMKRLTDIIARGGDVDPAIAERSLNMARDAEATAMTGQSNDLRAQLASRGRASTPGVTQGGEVDALTRLTEALAPTYAGQVAGIENTAAATKASSLRDALSLATGLSSDESHNLLSTLGAGTQRQTALSSIALQQLGQDQQWNEFLASYGLQKDQVEAMIQQGNINSLLPYLKLFLDQAEQGAQGYIGNQ